jgi:hypothetical protein
MFLVVEARRGAELAKSPDQQGPKLALSGPKSVPKVKCKKEVKK